MGFVLPFGLLIVLGALVGAALEWVFTPFLPFLESLDPAVLRGAVALLLAVNLLLFIYLLVLKTRWERSGQLSRAFVRTLRGKQRVLAEALRAVLLLTICWEALLTALCAAYFVSEYLGFL